MQPSFDVEGGLLLALTRAMSVAALLSVFGTLIFRIFVAAKAFATMPPEATIAIKRRLLRVTQFSIAACFLATLIWLFAQAADMADAASLTQAVLAVPTVVSDTAFGHLIAIQLGVLTLVALVLGRRENQTRQRVTLGLAAVATALQAGHGHAASMYATPSLLLLCDVLHLLGAGAWLGGLFPLLLVVRDCSPKIGATAARWFSPMGKWCIAALTGSAVFQSWVLIATIPGLVGTAYGWMAMVKLTLMGFLLGFAAFNRYRFAPALLREDPTKAKAVLVRSIAVQTGFGLAILAAAAILSSLPPAMHVQPIWPFPERFTLETLEENPAFRNEVLGALSALIGAVLLVAVAVLLRRRVRWLAVAAAFVMTWLAIPHLDLLFVPAYPTSFYHSPTGFAATGIVQGAALFPNHCAACHGLEGRGDGPAAKSLPVPPADLTAAHLWMHSDGELFWWLKHGIKAPDGQDAMPGFGTILSDDDRWRLIDYIRAHNAGLTYRSTGNWNTPVQAPELQARCLSGPRSLADFRGGFVRLIFGNRAPAAVPGVTTVLVTQNPEAEPASQICIDHDTTVLQAYSIVAGMQPADMQNTQFLVDGNGWLRAVQRNGQYPSWIDPAILLAEIHQLQSMPIAMPTGICHAHMQM